MLKRRRPDNQEPEWVIVATVYGNIEAEILAGLLRTASIPCMIQQESFGRVMGLSIGALGEITLLVPQQYEEEAIALLDEPNLDDFPPLIEDEPPVQF